MSDKLEFLTGLRVTREFTDEPVAAGDLDAILEAGRWTGSSKNRQGWVFIVVDGRDELDAVASAGQFTVPIRSAAAVIALVKTAEGNDFDIGRVAQSMMLAADAVGLGSCPVTLHRDARSREVLGLGEGESCRWVIALGHPDPVPEERQRQDRRDRGVAGRKDLSEVVRREPR
jgi:nitroreductase